MVPFLRRICGPLCQEYGPIFAGDPSARSPYLAEDLQRAASSVRTELLQQCRVVGVSIACSSTFLFHCCACIACIVHGVMTDFDDCSSVNARCVVLIVFCYLSDKFDTSPKLLLLSRKSCYFSETHATFPKLLLPSHLFRKSCFF